MNTKSILEAASRLPKEDRIRIVEALLDDLDATDSVDDQEQVNEQWRSELLNRSADLRSGQVKPVPWKSVVEAGERLINERD